MNLGVVIEAVRGAQRADDAVDVQRTIMQRFEDCRDHGRDDVRHAGRPVIDNGQVVDGADDIVAARTRTVPHRAVGGR
jgi:hypothetical protein